MARRNTDHQREKQEKERNITQFLNSSFPMSSAMAFASYLSQYEGINIPLYDEGIRLDSESARYHLEGGHENKPDRSTPNPSEGFHPSGPASEPIDLKNETADLKKHPNEDREPMDPHLFLDPKPMEKEGKEGERTIYQGRIVEEEDGYKLETGETVYNYERKEFDRFLLARWKDEERPDPEDFKREERRLLGRFGEEARGEFPETFKELERALEAFDPTPKGKGIIRRKAITEKKLKELFTKVRGVLIGSETTEENFCAAFTNEKLPSGFEPIRWIYKKNGEQQANHVKAFLALMKGDTGRTGKTAHLLAWGKWEPIEQVTGRAKDPETPRDIKEPFEKVGIHVP